MNPYESTALQSQLNLDTKNILNPELAQEQRSAAASGALGGSRSGIEQGMTTNQFNQNEMNQVAQGENTAYQTGEQQFNSDEARQLAANTQAAQTGISAANSNTYTNLASTQNSLEGIQAAESPEQQLATEAGIFASVPGQQTVTGTTTQNPGSILGGVATGILGGVGQLLNSNSQNSQGLSEGGQIDLNAQLADYLHSLDLHDIAEAVGA